MKNVKCPLTQAIDAWFTGSKLAAQDCVTNGDNLWVDGRLVGVTVDGSKYLNADMAIGFKQVYFNEEWREILSLDDQTELNHWSVWPEKEMQKVAHETCMALFELGCTTIEEAYANYSAWLSIKSWRIAKKLVEEDMEKYSGSPEAEWGF